MASLPEPAKDQPYWNLSALESGFIDLPHDYLIDTAPPGSRKTVPCLSFLLRHSKSSVNFVFDLGTRKDLSSFTPHYLERIAEMTFVVSVPNDAADSLAKGGLKPTDIDQVCLSHLHFDHIGDPTPYTAATFLVGAGSRPLLENGYPHDPTSLFDSRLLPPGRTRWLDPDAASEGWAPLGPFARALDLLGDGSLFVVDAGPGHVAGHVNALARTSADGGWAFLAGDSAHDWALLRGEAGVARHGAFGCAHRDKERAEAHMADIRRLVEGYPRVRVLLAHDVPWYEEQARSGKKGFWPGVVESL
ncbi:Metallo-hydrolase/oxidoreductase [Epithele typhae]|uniref:Metallo-hydrolase/oxidoreductase n=1 Tax=Epithele typhae TaxID=378194 RepID=UPI002007F588|nr:Metallo-hydrolase/oxidoreductase [Epithele typhae]KAH9940446.1 Metallo-hydrolase/oxidoreductase [Epithele typhae]